MRGWFQPQKGSFVEKLSCTVTTPEKTFSPSDFDTVECDAHQMHGERTRIRTWVNGTIETDIILADEDALELATRIFQCFARNAELTKQTLKEEASTARSRQHELANDLNTLRIEAKNPGSVHPEVFQKAVQADIDEKPDPALKPYLSDVADECDDSGYGELRRWFPKTD